jgi:hypothetical protein
MFADALDKFYESPDNLPDSGVDATGADASLLHHRIGAGPRHGEVPTSPLLIG